MNTAVTAGAAPSSQRRPGAVVLCSLALLLCWSPSASGQKSSAPDYTRGCTSSGCHAELKKSAVVHAPVASEECDSCHEAEPKAGHKFKFTVEPAELCLECHDEYEGKTVHSPVAEGQCTACHTPHGGAHKKLLSASPVGELCVECHEETTEDLEYLHGPVAAGACSACHSAHASDHAALLSIGKGELCLSCHDDMKDRLADAAHVHDPAKQDCGGCHDPHGGDSRMNLKGAAPGLCYDCHEDIAEAVEDATVKHSPMTAAGSCALCHDPHGTDLDHLLTRPGSELCLSCHDKPLTVGDRQIADVAAELTDNPVHHAPIAAQDCGGCHNPHGGENVRLLTAAYPKQFYSKFTEQSYALCFTCHDVEVFEEARTDDLTEFRNGDHNLHHLHVNRPVKGRSCRACHLPHAGKHPKLIAETVPFGSWSIPLNFETTETGGSCLPGCHRAYRYDRRKAVANIPK